MGFWKGFHTGVSKTTPEAMRQFNLRIANAEKIANNNRMALYKEARDAGDVQTAGSFINEMVSSGSIDQATGKNLLKGVEKEWLSKVPLEARWMGYPEFISDEAAREYAPVVQGEIIEANKKLVDQENKVLQEAEEEALRQKHINTRQEKSHQHSERLSKRERESRQASADRAYEIDKKTFERRVRKENQAEVNKQLDAVGKIPTIQKFYRVQNSYLALKDLTEDMRNGRFDKVKDVAAVNIAAANLFMRMIDDAVVRGEDLRMINEYRTVREKMELALKNFLSRPGGFRMVPDSTLDQWVLLGKSLYKTASILAVADAKSHLDHVVDYRNTFVDEEVKDVLRDTHSMFLTQAEKKERAESRGTTLSVELGRENKNRRSLGMIPGRQGSITETILSGRKSMEILTELVASRMKPSQENPVGLSREDAFQQIMSRVDGQHPDLPTSRMLTLYQEAIEKATRGDWSPISKEALSPEQVVHGIRSIASGGGPFVGEEGQPLSGTEESPGNLLGKIGPEDPEGDKPPGWGLPEGHILKGSSRNLFRETPPDDPEETEKANIEDDREYRDPSWSPGSIMGIPEAADKSWRNRNQREKEYLRKVGFRGIKNIPSAAHLLFKSIPSGKKSVLREAQTGKPSIFSGIISNQKVDLTSEEASRRRAEIRAFKRDHDLDPYQSMTVLHHMLTNPKASLPDVLDGLDMRYTDL